MGLSLPLPDSATPSAYRHSLPPVGVVVKSNYIRWLVPGAMAPHFDCIRLDPESPASIHAAVVRCRAVIDAGRSLLVFPEGTRARSGRLGRFI